MIYPTSSTLTALNAYRKKMNVIANNVANANTAEFKKSRVTFSEGPNGGVSATVDRVETPGILKESFRNDQVVEVESSNVDLAEEITEMIPSKSIYGANLSALRTQDRMMGSLIDIFS